MSLVPREAMLKLITYHTVPGTFICYIASSNQGGIALVYYQFSGFMSSNWIWISLQYIRGCNEVDHINSRFTSLYYNRAFSFFVFVYPLFVWFAFLVKSYCKVDSMLFIRRNVFIGFSGMLHDSLFMPHASVGIHALFGNATFSGFNSWLTSFFASLGLDKLD